MTMNAHPIFTRESAAVLERREVATTPRTFNEAARTVEAVIASSNPVPRRDASGEFLEILDPAGLDLESVRGVSLLDAHSQAGVASILGTVVRAWREGEQIVAELRISERADAAFLADVRSGVISNLSVGYAVSAWRDGEASGKRTRTATTWEIKEASFVPVPADRNARTRQNESDLATRNRSIRELGNRVGLSRDVIDTMIDSGQPIEQVRQQVLDHMTNRGNVSIRTAHNATTLDNPAEFQRAAGEALFARVHRSHQPSAQARQFADMTLADLARECLRLTGDTLAGSASAIVITRALQTTSDYPGLLGDTVGRVLREGYRAAPSGLRQLGRSVTAPDFRERNPLILDPASFKLEKVNEAGEFKNGSFVESGEKYRLATYGKIFGITRQAIINDDLGALADIPAKLGAQAAAFEAQYLADLLQSQAGDGPDMADGNPLFDAAHGNIASPTGAAPSDTTLAPARLAMRSQTGPAGELIDIVPRFLVVPAALETAAEKLLTAITPVTVDEVNPWSKLGLIVEPRLTDPKRWYLAAAAPQSGLELCYLSGAEGPQTETQAGFRIDGVETKVRLDFVAAWIDWRGIFTNPGQ